ncbi:MAG: hypothetical protein WDN24_04150 [Sphingomonas sp.]
MSLDRFLVGLDERMEDPLGTEEISVLLPEDIDPFERHDRYGAPLDAELRLARLGTAGGGTYLIEYDEDDDEDAPRKVAYCVLDTDATDVERARELLRLHLPELGCPPGTLVQYGGHEDRYDGLGWHLAEPRSIEEF